MLKASDALGNGPLEDSGELIVDTVAPELNLPEAASGPVPVITPDGDGVTDGISFAGDASERGRLVATVLAG